MDEADVAFLSLRITEEPEDEAELPEDPALAALQAEVDADTREFEAASWSLAVDAAFAQAQEREVARRQDVLYELMQTEAHHVRTLKLTQRVFARALRAAGAAGAAGSVLPGARELLSLHARFLAGLKRRRREGLQPGSARNYVIARVGDVLLRQFSGERAAALEDAYGAFCCGHRDAVTRYKTLLRHSRRFREAVRRIVAHPVARRLGVQECVLLVTQRITKYPVLVERLLQHTEAGTEEHADLSRALRLLRGAIARVDARVSECERARRLREIAARLDPRARARLPSGRDFRRDDLLGRKLRLDGPLGWKAASGRVKEVLAVLLSDALLLLQEKDQKLVFASVDGKPAAVALRRLLVREVAPAPGAMFLISAAGAGPGPEMYELHAASRDQRDAWMTHIRRAAESLEEEEEEEDREDREDRDQDPEGPSDEASSDAFALKLRDFRERLARKDRVIAQTLLEKQRIFLEMAGARGGGDPERPGGLFRAAADPDDAPRAEHLLRAALSELEGIQSLLCRRRAAASAGPGDQEDEKDRQEGPRGAEDEDWDGDEDAEQQEETRQSPEGGGEEEEEEELVLRVQTLSRLLLGLQAAVARQDSALEQLRAGEHRRAEEERRRAEEEREEREELRREREELERGRELYQRDLQRLREAQRRLERQREELRRRGSTPGSPNGEAPPPAAPPPPPGPAPPEARARGDVPPQLLSATNQLQRAAGAVRQQIPAKLAAPAPAPAPRGRPRGRGRRCASAGSELKPPPLLSRFTAKDGGGRRMRGARDSAPVPEAPPPAPASPAPGPAPAPPDAAREDVIFF